MYVLLWCSEAAIPHRDSPRLATANLEVRLFHREKDYALLATTELAASAFFSACACSSDTFG